MEPAYDDVDAHVGVAHANLLYLLYMTAHVHAVKEHL